MKKYLACALLAIGLTLNAEAGIIITDPPPPPPVTVPDNGNTAVLLGLGILTLAALYRRKATA
ncbi:MAG TPA: VPDSG-CTERM sorting domain-containing protein, partial [Terrimicrobiaceae bacterium]